MFCAGSVTNDSLKTNMNKACAKQVLKRREESEEKENQQNDEAHQRESKLKLGGKQERQE